MGSLFSGPDIKTPGSVKTLTGKNTAAANLKPINLTAGGLSSKFSDGSLNVQASKNRKGLVNHLAGTSLQQAGLLSGLRDQVGDATSGLRATRLREVENARRASVSNLRDNLARRRVLGSSFGQDAETRANLGFAETADRVEAESFLQEIDLNNQLINQEFQARSNAFATQLNELNFQANFAAGLSGEASSLLQSSAQLQSQLALQRANIDSQLSLSQAELDAKAQAGAGAFLGKVAGVAAAPFTGGASLALTGAPISITNQ